MKLALETANAMQSAGLIGPEYLIAMKLSAARPKDFTHIAHLFENSKVAIDFPLLQSLLSRFGLQTVWDRFLGTGLWIPKKQL